ncbi:alcohol oxidase [Lactarius indigo]|nr:alcohol oxidase [Lactarius indigo]
MVSSRVVPFSVLIAQVVAAVSGISVSSGSSPTYSAAEFASLEFDVLILGGGTAGLVVANRLSAPPTSKYAAPLRVGVIEAGPYLPDDSLINVPTAGNLLGNANVGTLIGNPTYDWCFESVPQSGLDGLVIQYPRGKVLGGSSAINSMVWQRGSRADYDIWGTTLGNGEEWTFEELLPFFTRSENWTAPSASNPALFGLTSAQKQSLEGVHGLGGPVQITYNNFLTDLDVPAAHAVVAAAGIAPNANPDDGNDLSMPAQGVARTVDPRTGLRSYSASAYFDAEAHTRDNLYVVTNAVASRILFDGRKAKAVEFQSDDKTYAVAVSKEVILAAGSLKTPQILELSGVGNRTLLERLGVPVVLDLPEVGENLQDHPVTLSDFKLKPGIMTLDSFANATFTLEQQVLFETNQAGVFTYSVGNIGTLTLQSMTTPSEFNAMRASLDQDLAARTLTPLQKVQYQHLKEVVDNGEEGWMEIVVVPSGGVLSPPKPGENYLTGVAIQQHINSTNIYDQPIIDPRIADLRWDLDVLYYGTKFLRKWIQTKPLADLIDEWITPPASLQDAEWEKFVKTVVRTTNHPLGTTAMAPRGLGGVVDPRMKIYGLTNVRVVDASVIPLTTGVAIQSTVYAIAEKAADILRKEWGLE